MEINKTNYKFYFKNRKAWRNFKKTIQSRPILFSKFYKPSKSSIYNDIGMAIKGGQSRKSRYIA